MSENLVVILLGIVGAILSLVFRYTSARIWFDGQKNKGLLMLAMVVVVAGIYFALACSSFAAQLGIPLSCSNEGAFDLFKAILVIATGNQLTFLYTKQDSKY